MFKLYIVHCDFIDRLSPQLHAVFVVDSCIVHMSIRVQAQAYWDFKARGEGDVIE